MDGFSSLLEVRRRSQKRTEALSTAAGVLERVGSGETLAGYWRDIYTDAQGRVLEQTPWRHNLVVDVFANLTAGLCIADGHGGYGATYKGVQYLAVGDNDAGVTNVNAGVTTAHGDSELHHEIYRVGISSAYFADNSGNSVNSAQPNFGVTATIPLGQPAAFSGTTINLLEFGLFGGNGIAVPTNHAEHGLMIDRVVHGTIQKPVGLNGDFALTRIVTILF